MLDFLSKSNHIGQANIYTAENRQHVLGSVRRIFFDYIVVHYDRMRVRVTSPKYVRGYVSTSCRQWALLTLFGGLTARPRSQSYDSAHKVGICPKIKSKFQSYCCFSSAGNNGNPISGERHPNGFRSKAHLIGDVA